MDNKNVLVMIIAANLRARAENLFLCGYTQALTIGNILAKGYKRTSIYRKAAFVAAHNAIKTHTAPRIIALKNAWGHYDIVNGLDLINNHASSTNKHASGANFSTWAIDSIAARTGYTIHIMGA
jgi:hypothetical protein